MPYNLVRIRRINLFIKIISQQHPVVLALITNACVNERSRLRAVERDMKFVSDRSSLFTEVEASILGEWVTIIRSSPNSWKQTFKKALLSEELNGADALPALVCGPKVKPINPGDGDGGQNDDDVGIIGYTCGICNTHKDDYQSLTAHMFSAHGQRTGVAMKIDSTICLCCNKEYHMPRRILNHVNNYAPCRDFYNIHVQPKSVETISAFRELHQPTARAFQRAGRCKGYAQTPVCIATEHSPADV